MPDWIGLSTNALWVFGSALALATLSQALWRANLEGIGFREQLKTLSNQAALSGAGLLFCLGLGLSPRQISLIPALWFLLALAFLANLFFLRKSTS